MTFIYQNDQKAMESLSVFPEAVRGMRYRNKEWRLYVSDPEPMAVSVFRIKTEVIKRANEQIQQTTNLSELKPMTPPLIEKIFQWLFKQEYIAVELVEAAGMPSMFPKIAGASPNPKPGFNPPKLER
jgi:hypothetical protein